MNASNPANSATPPANIYGPGVGARVFQNTIVQLGGRGVSLLLSFAGSILLARYLGRERMGEYGALYAYFALFSWLAAFGLESILAREVSQRRSESAQIFYTGMVTALFFGTTGTILAWLLAPLIGYSGQLHWLVAVVALDLMIIPAFRLPAIVFQVDMKQWYAVGISLLRQVLWLTAVLLLMLRSAAFYQVIIARTACGIIEAAVFLKVSYGPGRISGPHQFDWSEARQLLRYGFPLAVSAFSIGVFYRIDQIMLHKMAGAHVLGPYVVAVNLIEQLGTLPVALVLALAPVLAVTAAQDEVFRHHLSLTWRFLMAVVFFLCAVFTPVTTPLIALLYGKEFSSSAALLNVLIWSEVPLFLGAVLTHALIARNLQRYIPISNGLGAAMNIALNFVFIPRWGALGAAWASVISYLFAQVLIYLAFEASRSITLLGLRIAAPPFAVALAISLAFHFWSVHFAFKFIAAALLYSLGVWMTGTVRKIEIERLVKLVREALNRGRQRLA